jgi:hypothetical protein
MIQVFWLGVVAGLLYAAAVCGVVVVFHWLWRKRGEPGA